VEVKGVINLKIGKKRLYRVWYPEKCIIFANS